MKALAPVLIDAASNAAKIKSQEQEQKSEQLKKLQKADVLEKLNQDLHLCPLI